jgi:hypothetical protein
MEKAPGMGAFRYAEVLLTEMSATVLAPEHGSRFTHETIASGVAVIVSAMVAVVVSVRISEWRSGNRGGGSHRTADNACRDIGRPVSAAVAAVTSIAVVGAPIHLLGHRRSNRES